MQFSYSKNTSTSVKICGYWGVVSHRCEDKALESGFVFNGIPIQIIYCPDNNSDLIGFFRKLYCIYSFPGESNWQKQW
jgi:hypothetical protein